MNESEKSPEKNQLAYAETVLARHTHRILGEVAKKASQKGYYDWTNIKALTAVSIQGYGTFMINYGRCSIVSCRPVRNIKDRIQSILLYRPVLDTLCSFVDSLPDFYNKTAETDKMLKSALKVPVDLIKNRRLANLGLKNIDLNEFIAAHLDNDFPGIFSDYSIETLKSYIGESDSGSPMPGR